MAHTRRLDEIELRIVGSLLEKEKTTPETYPLTLKALRSACNQSSNRDPVTDLDEAEIRDALERLRRDVLVWRTSGARVDRWEQRVTSRWHLQPEGQAIMTLLILRGPQTPGELRTRSGRLFEFTNVEQVQDRLQAMTGSDHPLVRELARAPGQRENRWQHLMMVDDGDGGAVAKPGSSTSELEGAVEGAASAPSFEKAPVSPTGARNGGDAPFTEGTTGGSSEASLDAIAESQGPLAQAGSRIDDLEQRVARLEQWVRELEGK